MHAIVPILSLVCLIATVVIESFVWIMDATAGVNIMLRTYVHFLSSEFIGPGRWTDLRQYLYDRMVDDD